MDSAALAELNLRLADACRVEHHGKMLLEAIASDRSLPRAVRERAELHWIEAAGNYVHLHTAATSFLLRETLTNLADRLPKERFLRVHRSAVVALDQIVTAERLPSGDYELGLRSGARDPDSAA